MGFCVTEYSGRKQEIIGAVEDILNDLVPESIGKRNIVVNFNVEKNMVSIDARETGLIEWTIFSFNISELPGCCGVAVSHNSFVSYSYRRRGIGNRIQHLKYTLAQELGFTQMMATVTDDNAAEIALLEKHGWVRGHSFTNKRTGNDVRYWYKNVD